MRFLISQSFTLSPYAVYAVIAIDKAEMRLCRVNNEPFYRHILLKQYISDIFLFLLFILYDGCGDDAIYQSIDEKRFIFFTHIFRWINANDEKKNERCFRVYLLDLVSIRLGLYWMWMFTVCAWRRRKRNRKKEEEKIRQKEDINGTRCERWWGVFDMTALNSMNCERCCYYILLKSMVL